MDLDMLTELVQVSDGPVRPAKVPKKLSNTKALVKKRNNWQAFQTESKIGKKMNKPSMFRIGDGANARGLFPPWRCFYYLADQV